MRKPLVLVTDYFPPDPGNRARRMLERATHLSRHGYAVLVIAPHRKQVREAEESRTFQLPDRVHVLRIKPFAWRLLPSVNAADYRFLRIRLFKALRPFVGFLRMVPSAVVALRRFRMAPGSILYTMNNPVSLHLVGMFAAKRFGSWIAELRDPISSWEATRFSVWRPLVDLFERELMRRADAVVYRSGLPVDHNAMMRKYPASKIYQLPDYGVDYSAFENTGSRPPPTENGLIATYAGGYYQNFRPDFLFEAVSQFSEVREPLYLTLFGDPPPCAIAAYPKISFQGKIAYWELVKEYSKSHFLIMFTRSSSEDSATFYPSKFSELIAAGRPILLIGSERTPLYDEITSNHLGACANNETSEILHALNAIADMISSNSYNCTYRSANKCRFSNDASEQAFHDVLKGLD